MESVPVWLEYSTFAISIFMALIAISATSISYSVYAENSSPEVIVYLEQDIDSKTVLNLVIKNIGKGAAKNIVFKPESPLPQKAWGIENAQMPEAMDYGPIITGIPYLAPNASRHFMLGQYSGLEKWLGDKSIIINVECHRTKSLLFSSKLVHTSSSIDIFSFGASQSSDNSHANKITAEFKKLNKEVFSIREILREKG